MKNIYSNIYKANSANLKKAKRNIENNNVIGLPTETVYGLAGNAYSDKSVKKIFKLKKRPSINPLIIHFNKLNDSRNDVFFNNHFLKLYKSLCPGPVTFILKKKPKSKITSLVSNKSLWVGCRIPSNKIALKLLNSIDFPIAAPSANINTKTSVTNIDDLDPSLKKNIFTLDNGSSKLGLESTVIKTSKKDIKILRLGSLTEETIKNKIRKYKIKIVNKTRLSPGNQRKHYSPKKTLRINVKNIKLGEGLLNFGKNNLKSKIINLNLSKKGNLKEASKKFYHFLNLIDNSKCEKISVAPIPNKGLGKVINDRLKKASYKKKN